MFLKHLDDIIESKLLTSILGTTITPIERQLFTLPIREGGLGITNLSEDACNQFNASKALNGPLIACMILQNDDFPTKEVNIKEIINTKKKKHLKTKVKNVMNLLSKTTLRSVEQAREQGASSWLSALPLKDQGFVLNKAEFRDALCLRYNRDISGLPSKCPCGKTFNTNHAMNCKKGGFVIMRHNNLRNFESNMLQKICKDVQIEPPLQRVNGEVLEKKGNDADEARLDIRARGFWRQAQNNWFDVRVTNPNSISQIELSLDKIYNKHENEKKKRYNERVINIEHGTFTPLVFSITGGMGPECTMYHKHLAERIAEKLGERYEKVLTYIRVKLSFIILKAALLCLRGSRSLPSKNLSNATDDFGLVCEDSKII